MPVAASRFTSLAVVTLSIILTACSKSDNTSSASAAVDTTPAAETVAPAAELITESSVSYEEGVPGGVKQNITTLTTTVTAIDYEQRTLVVSDADGKPVTITVPPEAVNFPQISQGDQVNIEFVEQVVISVVDADTGAIDGAKTTVSTAPAGSMPALSVQGQQVTTAKVTAIDVAAHKATLQFADGQTRVVAVRPDVALDPQQIGRDVVFETSQYLLLNVEKVTPQ